MSKRTRDSSIDLSLIDIPTDCFIIIFEFMNWKSVGSLIRVNKEYLIRLLSSNVIDAIITYVCKSSIGTIILPRWLSFAIPITFLHTEINFVSLANDCIQQMLQYPLGKNEHGCLTGGWLIQKIFSKLWDCDIDLFLSKESEMGSNSRVKCHQWDIITLNMDSNIMSILDRFDLSVCQIGYSIKENEIYITPLLLYTLEKRKIIVMPSRYNIFYLSHPIRYWACKDPWDYITESKKLNQFHYDDTIEDRNMNNWMERVRKYAERFREYSFIYCRTIF